MVKKALAAAGLWLLAAINLSAQLYDDPRMMSFESNADLQGIKVVKGKLGLSGNHFRNGAKSLEWNFESNGTLTINRNLGFEPRIKGNRDNYLSAFIVWLYNETPAPQNSVDFQFCKNGKVCSSFPVNINFKGWRGIWVCYERDMQGQPEVGMDEIRIQAPQTKGRLYIDHLITAIKVDPRYQTADEQVPFVNAKSTNNWLQVLKNSQIKADIGLEPVTDRQHKDMKEMERRFRSLIYTPAKLYPKQMDEIRSKFKFYRIKEKNGNVTGAPIWFVRHAEAYERMIPNWNKDILTRSGFEMNDYFMLMQKIAIGYNNATSMEDMAELKKMFLQMYANITDQGVTYGSCWGNIHHYGYSMRSMYIAYFLMKDVLREAGKLAEAEATMAWYSQVNQLYVKPLVNGMDMDTFNTASIGCLASILLMDDSPEKVRYLRSCSRWLDWGCRPAPGLMDSFKTDGSAYHHCNNYPAYAIGGLNGATQMIYILSQTEFAISELAHQTVKNSLLAMRFYCNTTHFPLSMSGRHPDGKGHLTPIHYANMAMAGTPDRKKTFDDDMAAVYMRLVKTPTSTYDKKIFADFQAKNIQPEADPHGNLSLGYACAAVQRRGNWSAVVRGTSRYLWSSEHYVGENIYGRYLGYGSMQILTAPVGKIVTPLTSGWQPEGFDWNRIPGTTSIHLPMDDLKAKIRNVDISSGVEEMLYSDEAFAGGLSQMGMDGNFGMKLHEHDKYNGSFRARKSYHFFDNLIVCLGSDIENNDTQNPTETTLFQFAAYDNATQAYWKSYESDGHTWLDPVGTGYFTPAKVSYTGLVKQQSRDNDSDVPNEGMWASAVINHGTAPHGATYEYAVLPQTTSERLAAFAAKPTYTVIANNRDAHIVRSTDTNTLSYVIFEKPQSILPGGPLLQTDTTCLAMVRQMGAAKMVLTVAQPDLALYRGPSDDVYKDGKRAERSIYGRPWIKNESMDIPVTLTLLGKWSFNEKDNVKLVSRTGKTTTILVNCKDGLSYDIELNKL